MKIQFIVVLILFLVSCSSKPQQSILIGSCKEILTAVDVWASHGNIYVGDLLLSSANIPMLANKKSPIGQLAPNTKLKIAQILRGADGSFGPFLRVVVEITDGIHTGSITDIPSCVPYHPSPRWVNNCTLVPDELEFNNEIIRDCKDTQ